MRRLSAAATSLLLLAHATAASEPIPAAPGDYVALPWPGSNEASADERGWSTVLRDSIVYDNTRHIIAGWFYSPQPQAADDLHLTAGGLMTAFVVGYYSEAQGFQTHMTVTFYENVSNDRGVGKLVAGPYTATNLPLGPRLRRFNLPDSLHAFVGSELWCSVQFNTFDAGVIFSDPPTTGSSHDLFYDFGTGQTGRLNNVPANFVLLLEVDTTRVAVEHVTWSAIKELYRSARSPTPVRGRH